jgi:uncharacterized membrane protein SpoIIM required for sporulation
MVLILELPAFWYSVAMGISMGHAVRSGTAYVEAFQDRIVPYLAVIVPALLISAIAESIAIQFATPSKPRGG